MSTYSTQPKYAQAGNIVRIVGGLMYYESTLVKQEHAKNDCVLGGS